MHSMERCGVDAVRHVVDDVDAFDAFESVFLGKYSIPVRASAFPGLGRHVRSAWPESSKARRHAIKGIICSFPV